MDVRPQWALAVRQLDMRCWMVLVEEAEQEALMRTDAGATGRCCVEGMSMRVLMGVLMGATRDGGSLNDRP